MIALQVLSKVINTGSTAILEDNLLDETYFVGFENEYHFIVDHVKQYGNVPDRATFIGKFPDLELVEVTESDRYLVDTIREENLYYKAVPIMQKVASLLQGDANAAAEYMLSAVKELQPNYGLGGVDIIHEAQDRYDKFVERKEHQESGSSLRASRSLTTRYMASSAVRSSLLLSPVPTRASRGCWRRCVPMCGRLASM